VATGSLPGVRRTVPCGDLTVIEEEYRFKFLWRGRLFLGANKGCLRYGDFYKSKPDLFPVLTPSGREVTTSSAYRYNHHHSIWIGHARINGVNVFHDNNPQRPNLGDIALEAATLHAAHGPEGVPLATLTFRLAWVAREGRRLATEERVLTVRPAAGG